MGGARSVDHGARPGAVLDRDARAQRPGRDDIDLWELNEAFAAQVLACLAAWEDEDFCREVLGLDGRVRPHRPRQAERRRRRDLARPPGRHQRQPHRPASRQRHARAWASKRGIATECIGGGQGGAMLAGGGVMSKPVLCTSSARRSSSSVPARTKASRQLAHWRRDDEGIAWLVLDRRGPARTRLSEAVLRDLAERSRRDRGRTAEGARPPLGQARRLRRRRRYRRVPRHGDGRRRRRNVCAQGHAVLDRLEALTCPTIAVVHGYCARRRVRTGACLRPPHRGRWRVVRLSGGAARACIPGSAAPSA